MTLFILYIICKALITVHYLKVNSIDLGAGDSTLGSTPGSILGIFYCSLTFSTSDPWMQSQEYVPSITGCDIEQQFLK